MISGRRGFTLIETLIATVILTSGLISIAWMFVYSAATNRTNHDRTVATLLVQQKLDELKAAPTRDRVWDPGDYSDHPGRFQRDWQIRGDSLKTVTITASADRTAITGRRLELARATTKAAP